MYEDNGKIMDKDEFYLTYGMQSSEGQSGAPLLKQNGSDFNLIGIHKGNIKNNDGSFKIGLYFNRIKSAWEMICELAEDMNVENLMEDNYKPSYKRLEQKFNKLEQ